ncbi:hypothetical protein DYBT9623_01717 [Dyadobacter sp. CECT 9623]|uniref:Bacterial toxin 23 domain-containing protein n=1 Tax=Dyadobacter linearis TaxID=2823330 RepID=A0ABM8UNK3_9BACT|nr:polymorphic toxin type 23 domain-containing protein [Dyadobacter sp. CECT 9623]CAG5068983.1 hypothetical protein DYBT9623_01717 [Dyadobacter sp. CECT 9623]
MSTNPGVGVGWGGWNYSWGVSYNPSKFNISIGGGGGKNHYAMGGGIKYSGYGLSYYQTYYGAKPGLAGPAAQTVGGVTVSAGKLSFRIENDFLAFDDHDRWHSNAVEISYGNLTVGTRLYNNDPRGEKSTVDPTATDRLGNKNTNGFGSWMNGLIYESPLWAGVKVGNTIDRVGYSHPRVQDRTQNWVHRNGFFYLPFGHQNYYTRDSEFQKGFFFGTGYYNRYSLWGK